MGIWTFEGPQGYGKTLSAVAIAYEEYKNYGKKVICNNHLNFPYTHFNLQYFLDHFTDRELENCVLILDEAYQYMDSRLTQTKLNKLFTYFVVQTRKRGVDLFVCTHHINNVDIRLRRAVDVRGACSYFPENPCKLCGGKGVRGNNGDKCSRCLGYGQTGFARVSFLQLRGPASKLSNKRRRFTVEIFAPRYWSLYDTHERLPIQKKMFEGLEALEVV